MDFANTVYDPNEPAGSLRSWNDLVDFLEAVGAKNRSDANRLRYMNIHNPRGCSKALAHTMVLRDSLRKVFASIEAKKGIPLEWIMAINVVLRSNEGYKRLVRTKAGWDLRFDMRREEPLQVLVCVARSAAKLIEQGLNAPVRKCGNPNCLLYFYDVSRTRRRRWCSMAICGNRMKVAAYARRNRERKGMQKKLQ